MRRAGYRLLPALLLGDLLANLLAGAPAKAPFTFEAMMKLLRIDDAQLSPDGRLAAFTAQSVDLAENTKTSAVYLVPLDGSAKPVKLAAEGKSNSRPRWSPDGTLIYFLSDRKDGTQVWSMNPDGSGQKQITSLPTEAGGESISPDGKLLLMTSEVYPKCGAPGVTPGVIYDAECNRTESKDEADSRMHARVYTSLLYRHWTAYEGAKRQHLLIQSIDGGPVRDLTPGNLNVPPFSLGGPEGYVFSPDSRQIAYVADISTSLASSTNSDIFTIAVNGGQPKRITTNVGADSGPQYSPDGKYLAYRTQLRGGYESDRWRLAVLDLASGKMHGVTDALDLWVEELAWSPDSTSIFFVVDDHGTNPVLKVPVEGGAIGKVLEGPASHSGVQFTPDGKTIAYLRQSGSSPAEIYSSGLESGGSAKALTHLNDSVLEAYRLTPLESITTAGADGATVQSFIVKPPGFDPSRKYPVLMAIHGGPEGEWGESWTYRWNAQVFAAAGFVVVLPNPRGSIGYGQAFTDGVNGDWGGRAYRDIMATADYVGNLPYVDRDRMAAAGGSYGGYMVDWILGHTNRFRALVSHSGVFDLRSEAGTTEELWFPKWEFRGLPWENGELYEKWSPSSYVKNFKTPTLVTHGELDYRVPIGQGQQLFTALQEMKVPSKLVQFPDEGHWILKPQNSRFWYATVIEWLNEYTRR